MENKTWADVLAWVDENEAQHNSDCGFFIRYALEVGLDKFGAGLRQLPGHRARFFDPELYEHPTIDGRNAALISRSGIYAGGELPRLRPGLRVREDTRTRSTRAAGRSTRGTA